MHFPTIILPIALSLSLASATPAPKAPYQFHLKTVVHPGQDTSKDGLYLSAYHVGAGDNDAWLTTIAKANKVSINDTHLNIELQGTTVPWGLEPRSEAYYTQWLSVGIPVGYGSDGFVINDSKLEWNEPGFNGWLACDWWHGVPQLFWKNTVFDPATTPRSCSSVDLVTEKLQSYL